MAGEMWMSFSSMGGLALGRREGKLGRLPSSLMNTDSKYELSRFAFSESLVNRVPALLQSGAIPEELTLQDSLRWALERIHIFTNKNSKKYIFILARSCSLEAPSSTTISTSCSSSIMIVGPSTSFSGIILFYVDSFVNCIVYQPTTIIWIYFVKNLIQHCFLNLFNKTKLWSWPRVFVWITLKNTDYKPINQ